MNHRMRNIVLAVALFPVAAWALRAGEHARFGVSEASAESVGSMVALPVLSLFGVGISLFGYEGEEGLLQSVMSDPKPVHAEVTAVRQREDGSREVELAAREPVEAEGPPVRATVVFPKRDDGADEIPEIGDSLDFEPSAGGSGWLVHRNGGVATAFLPVPHAQQDIGSERL